MSAAPAWVAELLCTGAEHLAAAGGSASRASFKVHPGSADEWTAEAFMSFDPSNASLRLFVRDAESGRVICRSRPVVLDALDDSWFDVDPFSPLASRRPA